MKSFVEFIAKNIVDDPEQVSVIQKEEKNTIYFEVLAPGKDIGKIIGRNGQTIKAIRTILNASGSKLKKKIILNVRDTNNNQIQSRV